MFEIVAFLSRDVKIQNYVCYYAVEGGGVRFIIFFPLSPFKWTVNN